MKKATLFGAILVVYIAANLAVNWAIIRTLRLPLKRADLLIAGDSHIQHALDPAAFPSAASVAQGAEPYPLTYWKLQRIFNTHRPRTLVLGFSHHSLSAFNDVKFTHPKWATEMFKRSYLLHDFRTTPDIPYEQRVYLGVVLGQVGLFPHTGHITFIGGYSADTKNKLGDGTAQIKRHFFLDGQKLGLSKNAMTYLDAIINLCRRQKVEPVLVASPVHPTYLARIPKLFRQQFEREKERLRQRGIRVIDRTATRYPDELYLDNDHLNARGAARFSKTVADLLAAPPAKK